MPIDSQGAERLYALILVMNDACIFKIYLSENLIEKIKIKCQDIMKNFDLELLNNREKIQIGYKNI